MTNAFATSMPLFWGHGKDDPLVKYILAEQSIKFLKEEVGIKEASGGSVCGLEFHGYPGLVHSAHDKEIADLQVWLQKVLPPSS